MVTIFIVEDEKPISALMCMSLRKAGYRCVCAYDGEQAVEMLEHDRFDLVLLDVMLPGLDGFSVMEYIRPLGIPVIFLTARGALSDKVRGLRMGAEDYMVKPFEVLELLARVDVVLRRWHKTDPILEIGGLRIDLAAMQVWRGEQEIVLTRKEYEILVLFAQNPGIALYRETIYERVWHEDFPYGSKTVDLHIQRLRKKVGWEQMLLAVNKVGYRLEASR